MVNESKVGEGAQLRPRAELLALIDMEVARSLAEPATGQDLRLSMLSEAAERLRCDERSASEGGEVGRLERERPHDYWVVAKGRTHAEEPLYGVQIMDGFTDIVDAEGEAETLAEAISDALALAQGATPEQSNG